jgi:hypothetical protein
MSTQEKINRKFQTNLNAEGDQLTIQIGDDTGQVFVSKKSAREFVTDSFKGGFITQEAAQEIGKIISGAKNLKDIGPEDIGFSISITLISFRGFNGFGFPPFSQEEANDEPMKNPKLEMCPRCGEHASIVDTTGIGGRSRELYSKKMAFEWVQTAEEKQWVTPEQVKELKTEIENSKLY